MTERQQLRAVARRLRELAAAGRAEAKVLREADHPARHALSRIRSPARRLYTRLTGRLPANRLYGRLHNATESLADIASEVSAYADLLEEKAGRLESWHRKHAGGAGETREPEREKGPAAGRDQGVGAPGESVFTARSGSDKTPFSDGVVAVTLAQCGSRSRP